MDKQDNRDQGNLIRGLPTLVSFCAGDDYYLSAAASLRSDCERLGMPFHIEQLATQRLDWGEICRLKIDFYRRMHDRFGAILWTDVDTRLLAVPEQLRACSFDMAGFVGRFRYIRDFDPYETSRFWIPALLYFGESAGAASFIELMGSLEARTKTKVTDDWVLQEAWKQHEHQMSVGFLPPRMVARGAEAISGESVFLLGDSGNVSSFRKQVEQHPRPIDSQQLRSKIVGAEAVHLMKQGDRASALHLAKRAYDILPSDPNGAVRLSRYLKIIKSYEESRQVLEKHLESFAQNSVVREELLKRDWEQEDYASCKIHLDMLRRDSDVGVRARAESLTYEVSLDERAHRANIPSSQRLSLWWMKTPYPGNFGDILSPWIMERVTGAPVRFGPRDTSFLAVGSIIKFATAHSTVWGSGAPRRTDDLCSEATYKAVRGPLTRELILANGGKCPQVYGDPALLLPRFIPAKRNPRHKLGFIRHVSQNERDIRLDGVLDVRLSGVGDSAIDRIVGEITDCEAVLSTSLHGIIVANAYGIPARWCFFSDSPEGITGDGTKFEDYFLSVGLPVQIPFDLSNVRVLDESFGNVCPSAVDLHFDADRLITAYHD